MLAQVLSRVQLFCDSMDCGLPGSSVHGIFQARILECVATSLTFIDAGNAGLIPGEEDPLRQQVVLYH